MPITLETIIGNAVVDENRLIYMQVERASEPTITANFPKNVSRGYVVVEAPGNIEGFLMDNFAKDEQNLVFGYEIEEEGRVKEHNERERQKIAEWGRLNAEAEERYNRLVAEWKKKEAHRIPEWQERERIRREEYDLELEIRQEEAEREGLGYAGLVFDALKRRGRQVGAIRIQYEQQGFLNDLRLGWLRTYLTREGIQDETVLEEILALARSKNPVLSNSLKEILVKQLGVEFPDASQKGLLPPYKPEPIPEPEPKPKLEISGIGPRPKLELKETTRLLPELESVVLAAYKGVSLEEINLTQQAWNAAGISPQEIYDRVRKNVRFLNTQYMLVRVIGHGDGNAGSLTLVETDINHKGGLRQGVPKMLRSRFQRPTSLVEDAYVLSLILLPKLTGYLEDYEKGNEALSNAKAQGHVHLARAIYKAILGRTTPLTTNLFPEIIESSASEDELSKYENLAQRVKSAFEKGLLDAYDIPCEGKSFKVSANELVDTVRYLVDLLPEELFELRYQMALMEGSKHILKNMRRREIDTNRAQSVGGFEVMASGAKEKASSLISELGILAEGRKDEWRLNARLGLNTATNVLNRYGISYTTTYTNQMAGK